MSISDHIVLMKAGVKQQYDKPQRLYDEPANQFVADFLGNPPINNIPGTFANGVFTPDGGEKGIALRRFANVAFSGRAHLSIRAESVVPEQSPAADVLTCRINSVYKLGKDEMALISCGDTAVRVYLSSDFGYEAGDVAHLSLKNRGVFLFDEATGERYTGEAVNTL